MNNCPACDGRHATAAERRKCMAAAVRRTQRRRLREAFGLRGGDDAE